MSPIKDLQLVYEALGKYDTFSTGDTVAGTLSFTLKDDAKLKKVVVKLKGRARVHWSEGTGDRRRSHTETREYFNVKKYFVEENGKGTELSKGDHRFPFELKIPEGDFPSSFKGFYGKITYSIEAKLSRSWRVPTTIEKEICFVSKTLQNYGQTMLPSSGAMDKEVGVFSKGQVKLSASIDKTVCYPGDIVSIVGTACNFSSKETKVKFSLDQKIEYRAHCHVKYHYEKLCKLVGNTLKENAEETVSCQIKIPEDATPTLHNCDIVRVQYCIKVYLDISFAFDPEVELPLVVMPLGFASHQSGAVAGPHPGGFSGAPSYNDFPPPGYPQSYPGQQASSSGYSSQWPQQVPQYGFASAAYPPSMGQHYGPTAPPTFQQEGQTPSYPSLYPSI
ncbi:arrestin domain-containing protein 3-like [Nelusetta ayraudi]|uniref:arrestin domain-containing protein 3-like n=1 Tax=Nelusetta ayraudi TaxID=303726 RepID=UPI003F6F7A83